MKPVKELKPYKFKAYDKFYQASMCFLTDRQLKELLDYRRKVR